MSDDAKRVTLEIDRYLRALAIAWEMGWIDRDKGHAQGDNPYGKFLGGGHE